MIMEHRARFVTDWDLEQRRNDAVARECRDYMSVVIARGMEEFRKLYPEYTCVGSFAIDAFKSDERLPQDLLHNGAYTGAPNYERAAIRN